MPFGPYASFDDCVARNSDKASPQGFCAWMEHQITGAWPSQSAMPEEAWNLYMAEYDANLMAQKSEKDAHEAGVAKLKEANWFQIGKQWFQSYEAPKMRTILNVRVFQSGEWVDSSGMSRTWAEEDLDSLVKAFNAGVPAIVPLKAGHTPDAFNEEIARALGVPVEVATGHLGNGQITLGKMISLERRGNLLMAGFERVPVKIADLIEGGQFNTVSVEIENELNGFSPVMTAVALLGAEEPAVDTATLDRALVFGGKREGASVVTMAVDVSPEKLKEEFGVLQGKINDIIKGMRGAPIFRALFKQLDKLFEQMTNKKHQTTDAQVTTLAKSEYQGNVQALINWVRSVGFDACVSSLTGKPGITDPARVCGWLKGQAHTKEGKGKMKLTFKALKKRFQGEEITPAEAEQIPPEEVAEVVNELVAIAVALGLAEDAGLDEILTAIETLKAGAGAVEEPAVPEEMKQSFSKMADEIKGLKHDKLVSEYKEETVKLTHIPGKPEEIAESLATLEENTTREQALSVLKTYQEADKIAVEATKAHGSARPGAKSLKFQEKVNEYSAAHPDLARVECTKITMRTEPDLYRESVEESRRK